jgi:holliday junction DNA helicase RuvA
VPAGGTRALPPRDEALQALLALGYKAPEAQKMLDKAGTDGATTEELIRGALMGAVTR